MFECFFFVYVKHILFGFIIDCNNNIVDGVVIEGRIFIAIIIVGVQLIYLGFFCQFTGVIRFLIISSVICIISVNNILIIVFRNSILKSWNN